MNPTASADPALGVERRLEGSGGSKAGRRIPREDFQYLQALEDAISYRVARAAVSCAACAATAPEKCEDHDRDLELIGEYQAASTLCSERIEAATRTPGRERP